jgi:hypothetical protein
MVRNLGRNVPDVFNSIQGQKFQANSKQCSLTAKNMVHVCGFQWGVQAHAGIGSHAAMRPEITEFTQIHSFLLIGLNATILLRIFDCLTRSKPQGSEARLNQLV